MLIMRLRLGVIALGVRLIVSLSSATDGVLLHEENLSSTDGSLIRGTKSSYMDYSIYDSDLLTPDSWDEK